jgi:hypothetical protein
MLVDCIDNTGIIAGEANCGSLPLVMPEKKRVKYGEELFPVNALQFVPRGYSLGEDKAAIFSPNSFAPTCIGSDIAKSTRNSDH